MPIFDRSLVCARWSQWIVAALACWLISSSLVWCQEPSDDQPLRLILHNAVVHQVSGPATRELVAPKYTAIGIQDGQISVLGGEDDIVGWPQDEQTRIVDLEGKCIVPGFIESHSHLTGLGALLMELDLTQATSWDEVVAAVESKATEVPEGQWIVGRGWHQSLWDRPPSPSIEGYPVHDALSRVSPKHPVFLMHRSGHASLANAEAMRLAGVNSATKDPAGGEILRNAASEPIGIFRETATGLIRSVYERSREEMTRAEIDEELETQILLAQQKCLEVGVTTFVDAGIPPDLARTYHRMAEQGKLRLPLWVMLRAPNAVLEREIPKLREDWRLDPGVLAIGGVKQMADGALGSHGAWLLDPYDDLEESTGLVVTPLKTIQGAADVCYRFDLQLCVHAIGDRANREVLNIFEPFVEQARRKNRDLRWRVEHAQHLSPEDIPRFSELGVIASMQAIHCTSDGPFVPERIGKTRAEQGAYVWQSLLKQGTILANGTDSPVEPVEPLGCFWSSITRECRDGSIFFGDQKMSRQQALRSYTYDAAYAIKQESLRGSIEVGKRADLVVLGRDIMSVPEDQIKSTPVEATIVGGEIVFQRDVTSD